MSAKLSEAEISNIRYRNAWTTDVVRLLADREAIIAELASFERAYGSLIDACNKAFGERPCHAEIVARIFEVQAELAAARSKLFEQEKATGAYRQVANAAEAELAACRAELAEAKRPCP